MISKMKPAIILSHEIPEVLSTTIILYRAAGVIGHHSGSFA